MKLVKDKIKILYVCSEDKATTKQRLLALADINVELKIIYNYLLNEKISIFKRIFRSISLRLGFYPERNNENMQIIKQTSLNQFDILFIEKGLSIRPSTLKKVKLCQPNIKIVSYLLDDLKNWTSNSWYYRRSLNLFDFHFSMNFWNVEELKKKGVKNVYHFFNSYSIHVHQPIKVNEEEKAFYGSDVTFLGSYEKNRAEYIKYIAENGIKIKIWGWGKSAESSDLTHPNILFTDKYVFDDEYAKVVCSSKINLCFLRKINRDTQTTRSIEIPACGGFMLAERTEHHQQLFEENKEAGYFESKEEMLDKINYYLKHEQEREIIATNGLLRCMESDYSYHAQLRFIINTALGYEALSNN